MHMQHSLTATYSQFTRQPEQHNISFATYNMLVCLVCFVFVLFVDFLTNGFGFKRRRIIKHVKVQFSCSFLQTSQIWSYLSTSPDPAQISRCFSFSYSSQQTLLVLLEGGQSRADLQQCRLTLLRATRHQTSVILNPKAVQSLVTHLRTTRTTLTSATNNSIVVSTGEVTAP